MNFADDPKHRVGKAISDGTIDAIANIGPINGAIMGLELGGGYGAIGGSFVGLTIQFVQFVDSKLKGEIKNKVYEFDKCLGKKITEFNSYAGKKLQESGKNLNKTAHDFEKRVGKAISGVKWNNIFGNNFRNVPGLR